MKHKTELDLPVSMNDLVEEIGNLRYDALKEFLDKLASKLESDADKDRKRGRRILSSQLNMAAGFLEIASTYIEEAWKICKKHTK